MSLSRCSLRSCVTKASPTRSPRWAIRRKRASGRDSQLYATLLRPGSRSLPCASMRAPMASKAADLPPQPKSALTTCAYAPRKHPRHHPHRRRHVHHPCRRHRRHLHLYIRHAWRSSRKCHLGTLESHTSGHDAILTPRGSSTAWCYPRGRRCATLPCSDDSQSTGMPLSQHEPMLVVDRRLLQWRWPLACPFHSLPVLGS